jgi:hypothetical protein
VRPELRRQLPGLPAESFLRSGYERSDAAGLFREIVSTTATPAKDAMTVMSSAPSTSIGW